MGTPYLPAMCSNVLTPVPYCVAPTGTWLRFTQLRTQMATSLEQFYVHYGTTGTATNSRMLVNLLKLPVGDMSALVENLKHQFASFPQGDSPFGRTCEIEVLGLAKNQSRSEPQKARGLIQLSDASWAEWHRGWVGHSPHLYVRYRTLKRTREGAADGGHGGEGGGAGGGETAGGGG